MLRLLRASKAPENGPPVEPETVDPLGSLAQAAVRGERQAERTLLVTVGPSLLRAVRGVLGAANPDVEDVVQEAMSALLAALPTFRGECRIIHFASRIAVQTALSARRHAGYRNRYTPAASPEELADLARDERSPADARAAAERLEAFRSLLGELPEVQAEALVLHSVLGYSVDETAALQRVPVNTVRSRLRNGIARLRARVLVDPKLVAILGPEP
ncbi:MAG TPA: RNA polymerase sigma factor [Polyangiaceae bacterium]